VKTVEMFSNFDYAAHPRLTIRFYAGVTYTHVIEAAVREIVAAGCGRIVETGLSVVDASHAFRRGKLRRK
jgi:hypothetical protein